MRVLKRLNIKSLFDLLQDWILTAGCSDVRDLIVGGWQRYHLLDVKIDDTGRGISHCCIASESFTFNHDGRGEWRQWEDNGDIHSERFTYHIQGDVIHTVTDDTAITTLYPCLVDNDTLTLILFSKYCLQYRRVATNEIQL